MIVVHDIHKQPKCDLSSRMACCSRSLSSASIACKDPRAGRVGSISNRTRKTTAELVEAMDLDMSRAPPPAHEAQQDHALPPSHDANLHEVQSSSTSWNQACYRLQLCPSRQSLGTRGARGDAPSSARAQKLCVAAHDRTCSMCRRSDSDSSNGPRGGIQVLLVSNSCILYAVAV